MLQAMSEHAELLNVGLNAAMVVIWAVYLQLFLIKSSAQYPQHDSHRSWGRAGAAFQMSGNKSQLWRDLYTGDCG